MSTPDDGARYPGEQPPGQYGPPPYGQAPYAQAPYGQAPYGQAPYGRPAYGYPYSRPTNSLAIVSLVLVFVFAPAGLVTGIIARRQIRQTGEDGDGLALAGIIAGGIVTALFVLLIVVWLIAAISLTSSL
jgi:hypothetical protein